MKPHFNFVSTYVDFFMVLSTAVDAVQHPGLGHAEISFCWDTPRGKNWPFFSFNLQATSENIGSNGYCLCPGSQTITNDHQ